MQPTCGHQHGPHPTFVRGSMRKYAGELRVGDVWTERPQNRVAQSYRVIGIAPGLASTTMQVTAESVTTGQRRTVGFVLVNRVEVCEEVELGSLGDRTAATQSLYTVAT